MVVDSPRHDQTRKPPKVLDPRTSTGSPTPSFFRDLDVLAHVSLQREHPPIPRGTCVPGPPSGCAIAGCRCSLPATRSQFLRESVAHLAADHRLPEALADLREIALAS